MKMNMHIGVEVAGLSAFNSTEFVELYGEDKTIVSEGSFSTRIRPFEVKLFATHREWETTYFLRTITENQNMLRSTTFPIMLPRHTGFSMLFNHPISNGHSMLRMDISCRRDGKVSWMLSVGRTSVKSISMTIQASMKSTLFR